MSFSKTQNPPRKHHYIPVFYLKRWADEDGRILQFCRPYRKVISKAVHPDATGYMDRLYELEGFPPQLAQQVEQKFFSPIDSRAADALDLMEKFGNAVEWTPALRSAWTRFMLSLLLRCPEDIQAIRKLWRKRILQTSPELEARYTSARTDDSPPTLREFMQHAPVADVDQGMFRMISRVLNSEKVGSAINNMRWRVLDVAQSRHQLLTSDRPLIRTHNIEGTESYIIFPIGPKLLFMAVNNGTNMKSIWEMDRTALVRSCNIKVVEGAKAFVYSNDISQSRFVENRFGKNPQIRLIESVMKRKVYKN